MAVLTMIAGFKRCFRYLGIYTAFIGAFLMNDATGQGVSGVEEISVLDHNEKGVSSEIYKVAGNGDAIFVAKVDSSGRKQFSPTLPCKHNDRFFAIPLGEFRYYQSDREVCTARVRLSVRPRLERQRKIQKREAEIIDALALNVRSATEAGDYGAIAMAYTEAGARLSRYDVAWARDAKARAYYAAGRALGTDAPVVLTRSGPKMSDDLKVAIGEFQKKEGLNLTWKLDAQVVSKLAGKPFYVVIFDAESKALISDAKEPNFSAHLNAVSLSNETTVRNLAAHLERVDLEKAPAVAALLLSEIATRLRANSDNKKLSAEAEYFAYFYAAKALNVTKAVRFDPIQGKAVISKKFGTRIRYFQISKKLSATGMLDYVTLAKLSRKDIAPYLSPPPK